MRVLSNEERQAVEVMLRHKYESYSRPLGLPPNEQEDFSGGKRRRKVYTGAKGQGQRRSCGMARTCCRKTMQASSPRRNSLHEYSYDGKRRRKVEGGATTVFVWHGENVLQEKDAGLVTQAQYVVDPED